mmetsp:Transcript_9103/g.14463  ORF Transcript_9103/g.14463 Transcript_9103/m.14463 type:complete len:289 (-) Transcript_9103:442-1308(-)
MVSLRHAAAAAFVLLTLVNTAIASNHHHNHAAHTHAPGIAPHIHGPGTVDLGTAGTFAILAKSGVSTVPASSITGDVGVSPIAQGGLTGFTIAMDISGTFATSTQVTGKMYAADLVSPTPSKLTTAVLDMQTAYVDAAGRVNPDFVEAHAGALGGKTLTPGLYKFATGVLFADDCTLAGSATDTWIFQIAGTMGIAAGKKILLTGGARAENIVWVVAGAMSFGATSHFEGIILGATSASFVTKSTMHGRVLVQTAVTLQMTTIVSEYPQPQIPAGLRLPADFSEFGGA